jgi:uncharacterized protein (TIGR00255 family)
MTGSGSARVDVPAGRLECEARSVNHRFLKVSTHLSAALAPLEPEVEERVRRRVERGHVTVSLRFARSPRAVAASFPVDAEAAAEAARRLRVVAKKAGLDGTVTLRDVLGVPGVVRDAGADDLPEAVRRAALAAIDGALEALDAARGREGAHLATECRSILSRVSASRDVLAVRAPEVPKGYRDRLQARTAALLEGTGIAPDPAMLAREVASFADRSDVAEELARLAGHLSHAGEILGSAGGVGRRLDFLVQEMHRELNTCGSKSQDPGMTAVVVDAKADVERLREQVQNFE